MIVYTQTTKKGSSIQINFLKMNHPELNVCGFFVPITLVSGVLGFLAAWVLVLSLERLRLTRYIAHLPVFFLGLCLFLAGLVHQLFIL